MCKSVQTTTARRRPLGYNKMVPAFKDFFMANLVVSLGPLVRLLAAIGAISSLMLVGLLNLVH